VNWVRNLRAAAGVATLTHRRRSEQIRAIELPPKSAAVLVRLYIRFTLSRYLNVGVNASLEEWEREVLTHPVFLVQSAMEEEP
jgi:hypothetical protein